MLNFFLRKYQNWEDVEDVNTAEPNVEPAEKNLGDRHGFIT